MNVVLEKNGGPFNMSEDVFKWMIRIMNRCFKTDLGFPKSFDYGKQRKVATKITFV